MEYFVNLPTDQFLRPGEWAKEMETVGWHGVCASDHFWVSSSVSSRLCNSNRNGV